MKSLLLGVSVFALALLALLPVSCHSPLTPTSERSGSRTVSFANNINARTRPTAEQIVS